MIKRFILLVTAALTSPSFASTGNSLIIEGGAGVLLSPEMLTDSYESAFGGKLQFAVRWQRNELGFYLIGERDTYSQSSRHASADVSSWAVGPGVMIDVHAWGTSEQQKNLSVYAHALFGNANYRLDEDNGTEVAKGDKDIVKVIIGGRVYFPIFWGMHAYTGPEISYSNIDFEYPASYSEDETSPVNLNIGGVAGLSYGFF